MAFLAIALESGPPLPLRPRVGVTALDALLDALLWLLPVWTSLAAGLVVGWSWKPTWVTSSTLFSALRSRTRLVWTTPPGFGARRVWLALTALAAFPALKAGWLKFHPWMWPQGVCDADIPQVEVVSQAGLGRWFRWLFPEERGRTVEIPLGGLAVEEVSQRANQERCAVTDEDVEDFRLLIEGDHSGPAWQKMMEKEAGRMTYVAWRRDTEDGPTQYRSRTVIEDCTPELMRDFFWDDEFRMESQWDDMLADASILEDCPQTGTQVVRWVRRFPFFCKPREYVFGRRIWEAENSTYYCITKSIDDCRVPKKNKPRRVDVFWSSWRIRPTLSKDGTSMTACEVMLTHWEEMGIQKDVAKLGIKQGMWNAVRKIEPGVSQYAGVRAAGRPLSRAASCANITTKIRTPDSTPEVSPRLPSSGEEAFTEVLQKRGPRRMRWALVAGGVVLAFGVPGVGQVAGVGLVMNTIRKVRNRR